ncbi:MAG TPA: ABC transporter substrate-binding protein [Gaiella sp.]|nr:ABC transporter substrate-binding protein [Gaiella sp.]
MNRFGRSAVLAGAALVALVAAIAASATTARSDRSTAPTAGAAVTNYVSYVHGKRGKADPKKSKVYIGWVNQQGGQVVIGGLATAGAQLAVRYVNDVLGGVGGHPVALVQCFIKSSEEEGTTCGQKLVNDKRISVIATGAVATGAQSLFATVRGKKPVITGVATTPIDGAQKNAIVLFGDAPHILLPFGNYAKNVLHAKTAAVVYPNAPGVAEAGQVIANGLKAAGIATKQVGYTQGQTDLTAPLTAAGATTADFIGPYGTASDCANQAKSLQQLGITDSRKIMTAPLCLNQQVIDALGDWPKWTYAIASSLYGDKTDKGMPAYDAVIKRYKAQKNAPDPWHIVAFSELLTTVRFLNDVGAKNVAQITPARVLARARAFKGPLALGAPKLQCGKYKDAPGICNDMFQAFTYEGHFVFKRASGWIGPLGG